MYEVILWFWFSFLWWLAMLSIFHVPVNQKYVFFGKMSTQVFCLFFNWVVFWYWAVGAGYTFWILTSYQLYNLQLFFSYSVGCIFIFSMVYFAVKIILSLITSQFLLKRMYFFCLREKKTKVCCYDLCQRVFCLCSLLGVLYFQD